MTILRRFNFQRRKLKGRKGFTKRKYFVEAAPGSDAQYEEVFHWSMELKSHGKNQARP